MNDNHDEIVLHLNRKWSVRGFDSSEGGKIEWPGINTKSGIQYYLQWILSPKTRQGGLFCLYFGIINWTGDIVDWKSRL